MANYLSIWRQLNKFLINLDAVDKINLSWEQRTALFGAYLVDGGVQSSTLKSYFSAIKHILKQDGYQWDENKALLSSLVKGCKMENERVKIRLPIQKGLMEMLLFEIERLYNKQPYLESMYKALFSLAYYGMLRVGEVTKSPHVLKVSNIHVSKAKNKILIVLYSSMTHGVESRPQKIKIYAQSNPELKQNSKNHRFFCPVSVTLHYMAIRGHYKSEAD